MTLISKSSTPPKNRRNLAIGIVGIALLAALYLGSQPSEQAGAGFPPDFQRVTLEHNGLREPAWYYRAEAEARPLLVSLHSWSGDADQFDPLASLSKAADWHYIHPNFGGPNTHPGACLSATALAGIDAAIDYAIEQGDVDVQRIFVTGESGGGYAALGSWLQSRHLLAGVIAWVPISDLLAWHEESQTRPPPDPERKRGYDADIRACTGSQAELNVNAAKARSPQWMPAKGTNLETPLLIAAGIHDGHDGAAVPVSHSIRFFNRLAQERGEYEAVVDSTLQRALLARDVTEGTTRRQLGDRAIHLERQAGPVRLIIFEGGHESLPEVTMGTLGALAGYDERRP